MDTARNGGSGNRDWFDLVLDPQGGQMAETILIRIDDPNFMGWRLTDHEIQKAINESRPQYDAILVTRIASDRWDAKTNTRTTTGCTFHSICSAQNKESTG